VNFINPVTGDTILYSYRNQTTIDNTLEGLITIFGVVQNKLNHACPIKKTIKNTACIYNWKI
jgi:hypothetical protein